MVGRLVAGLRTRKQGSTLARLLDAAELELVDVGARGAPPPPLRRLAPHAHLFAFEPEADEVERLRAGTDTGPWAEVTVVPEALASSGAEAKLYVTEHPGMSSLLPPDPAVVNRYWK